MSSFTDSWGSQGKENMNQSLSRGKTELKTEIRHNRVIKIRLGMKQKRQKRYGKCPKIWTPNCLTKCITKTCLYILDPLKPHFYIVKLGFTGVYIIFLIFAQNIDCGYSLELPRRGIRTSTHNLCFEHKYENYQSFLSEHFQFCWRWKFLYTNVFE